jgi:hypothetical protein
LRYFQTTPGVASNSTITSVVADTKFSHDRGFYTNAFSSHHLRHTGRDHPLRPTGGAHRFRAASFMHRPFKSAERRSSGGAYKTGMLASDVDAQTYIFRTT